MSRNPRSAVDFRYLGLLHFFRAVEARELLRERLPQGQRFRAFPEHRVRHPAPHLRIVRTVFRPARRRRIREPLPLRQSIHRHSRRLDLLALQREDRIIAAGHLARHRSLCPHEVDRRDGRVLPAPFGEMQKAVQRMNPTPLAIVEIQRQFVVGRVLRHSPPHEFDLVFRHRLRRLLHAGTHGEFLFVFGLVVRADVARSDLFVGVAPARSIARDRIVIHRLDVRLGRRVAKGMISHFSERP